MDWLILVLIIVVGVILSISLIGNMILFMTLRFTPASTFLWAWMRRRPVFCHHGLDNVNFFKCGSKVEADFSNVKNAGPYLCRRGTGMLEEKSKVMIYHVLSDNSDTQQLIKAAPIAELRELGYKLMGWADLEHIFKCAVDNSWVKEMYTRLKEQSQVKADQFKGFVNKVRSLKLNVFLHKSYRINELYDMHSNRFSPTKVQTANDLAVHKALSKRTKDWVMIVGLVTTLLIVAAVTVVIIRSVSSPEVVVKLADGALANATRVVG